MVSDPRQNKRARTRDQLLIAAQELLMEQSVTALGIRQVAERAGLVHASFYNYFRDIGALLDGLGDLILATHALTVAPVRDGVTDHVALFAATTRQTLRLIHNSPRFARLLFDSGIPIDRLLSALHEPLRADLRAGVRAGAFAIDTMDVAVSIVSGSMISLAVDLFRGRARAAAIDDMTQQLLRFLNVSNAKARAAAFAKIEFQPPPPIPLSWKALGLSAPETAHVA